jgi:hypothetical protein
MSIGFWLRATRVATPSPQICPVALGPSAVSTSLSATR